MRVLRTQILSEHWVEMSRAVSAAPEWPCVIAGIVHGDIYHRGNLTIEREGLVIGDVHGDRVVIAGAVTGSAFAQRFLRLHAGASVGCLIAAPEIDLDPRACVMPATTRATSPTIPVSEQPSQQAEQSAVDPDVDRPCRASHWPKFVR